jgi:predicted TIM-barrel fold metal-dependent hydrolase
MKTITVLAVGALMAVCSRAQSAPIIDMHMHALRATSQGPPPVSLCAPPSGYPPADSGAAWSAAFMALLKNAPCGHPLRSPATDLELMERTLAIMKQRNIYGVASGPMVKEWQKAAGDRIIPGLGFSLGTNEPSVARVVEWFKSGQFTVLGEVGIQYQGIEPGDQRMEPYLAAAEQLDVPLLIHVGPGPPGTPYLSGSSGYRARLHSPLVLEEALVRHPKLRVVAMHAGWPMLDDTLAMLWTHPQLYLDVGVISFAIPRAAFHNYLRAIVEAGFGQRVLFGSDQMVWPEAIEVAIESIETAAFLNPAQKRDILYHNAARFLRLSQDQIARHHGKQ